MISELFVNGDSYSAASSATVPYSTYLGELLDIPVTNSARSGSSNDRIFRTTLEYCLSLSPSQRPLIVVGFSFVTREETWVDNASYFGTYVQDFPGSKFTTVDYLLNQRLDQDTMHLIIDQNINKQMINFYTKLFMLTQTLQQLNLPYFLFSAADNKDFRNLDWSSLKNLNMYHHIQRDSCVADLHNFNVKTWAENNHVQTSSTYHLDSDGHKKFANFLYGQINDTVCQR